MPDRIEHAPVCYVVAGPNGAGKTTFAMRYLPQIAACRTFINADMIAQGLSPLDTRAAEIEAGRLMLKRIGDQITRRQDFGFETTLSGRAHVRVFQRMKAVGFRIVLFYLWIPDARFSARRVAARVADGGHDIPSEAIRRRYSKSLMNFLHLYRPLADKTVLFDNSCREPVAVMESDQDGEYVSIPLLYDYICGQQETFNEGEE